MTNKNYIISASRKVIEEQKPEQQQENDSSFYKRIPSLLSVSGLWLHWADLYGLLSCGILSNWKLLRCLHFLLMAM